MKPRSWQESLISVPPLGSAQDLATRTLYEKELDAQGLLCAACGFPLGTGMVAVGTPDSYHLRPCAACAAYKFEQGRK